MSHSRAHSSSITSTAPPPTPHTLSLKVLRLSRPSLAPQTPLPPTNFPSESSNLNIPPSASLAYPTPTPTHQQTSFPLTPLLTLPAQFGAAYVGETFTCTLCANNEAPGKEDDDDDDAATTTTTISDVKVSAFLQTPGQPSGIALELRSSEEGDVRHRPRIKESDGEEDGEETTDENEGKEEEEEEAEEEGVVLRKDHPLQLTLRHELKEQGPHVLAVTVTYTERIPHVEGERESGGKRKRTFRKLYQFVAQQLVVVRSKVTERKLRRVKGEEGRSRQWVLEAQLENVGEASVVVEKVFAKERGGVVSRLCGGGEGAERTVLKPQDVQQVMFVLETSGKEIGGDPEMFAQGRVTLAQLGVEWRNAMGEKGSLTTGWLASKG